MAAPREGDGTGSLRGRGGEGSACRGRYVSGEHGAQRRKAGQQTGPDLRLDGDFRGRRGGGDVDRAVERDLCRADPDRQRWAHGSVSDSGLGPALRGDGSRRGPPGPVVGLGSDSTLDRWTRAPRRWDAQQPGWGGPASCAAPSSSTVGAPSAGSWAVPRRYGTPRGGAVCSVISSSGTELPPAPGGGVGGEDGLGRGRLAGGTGRIRYRRLHEGAEDPGQGPCPGRGTLPLGDGCAHRYASITVSRLTSMRAPRRVSSFGTGPAGPVRGLTVGKREKLDHRAMTDRRLGVSSLYARDG